MMNSLLIRNVKAVFPESVKPYTTIFIQDGYIKHLGIGKSDFQADIELDLSDLTLYPGFIDIHIHGAVGVDTNQADKNDLIKVAEYLARNGVTGWLPTFVPDADTVYRTVIKEIQKVIDLQDEENNARIFGVHYEGIFANRNMCGALRPRYFKNLVSGNEIKNIPKLKNGVHLTTLAPEIENGIEIINELINAGWIVSIGHTDANVEILDKAFEAGARHLTHFYNAMTGLHHRNLGVVGWGFNHQQVTFDIIADGIHVHPAMLKFAAEIKTPEKVLLISDSVLPTGLEDGAYRVWNENITVRQRKTENERGSIAGSVITMLDAVKMMLNLGFSESEVSKMASLNPAKLLGIDNEYGSIETGKRADFTALDQHGNVKVTVVGGKVNSYDLIADKV